MNQPFTDDEIIRLATAPPMVPNALWQRAFQYHNSQPDGFGHMNLSCRPCYAKVMAYILKKRFSQTHPTTT